MIKSIRYIFILFYLFTIHNCFSQDIYYHVSNSSVYNFIDELAGMKIIDINSVVKPYSRSFIAQKLQEAKDSSHLLSVRQRKEVEFYLKDFNKELQAKGDFNKRKDFFFYKDSLFTLSINPILGISYTDNTKTSFQHRWNGAEAFAYIGCHWGIYTNLRDNHHTRRLANEMYLNQIPGVNYKQTKDGGGDYSEMRGGITYKWNWGTIAFIKDHYEWGNNYNGSTIFSSKAPSYSQFKINLTPTKWFEFNYVHGWLVSEITDSNKSYYFTNSYGTNRRDIFRSKYLSTNLFTFIPQKGLHISLGNSIVYGDVNHPAYLIPVLFYKSVDHTLNATNSGARNNGQNSQMFIDISSRQIKHLHIYGSMFIDEMAISRFTKKNELNFFNYKAGFRINNLPNNIFLTAEYTRTLPLVYKHNNAITTYESNGYNMGHYLQDNAEEIYLSLLYKPIRCLEISASGWYAKRGPDYTQLGVSRVGNPYINSIKWQNTTFQTRIKYQVINDVFIYTEYQHSRISGENMKIWTPDFYWNTKNSYSVGLNIGF